MILKILIKLMISVCKLDKSFSWTIFSHGYEKCLLKFLDNGHLNVCGCSSDDVDPNGR